MVSIMTMSEFSSLIDQEVERLFRENPPLHGKQCRNPVTGAGYIGGLDPIEEQKDVARRALSAREWFRSNGPAEAQPLPVSYYDRDAYKLSCNLLLYIVALYTRSLDARHYDVKAHPAFADYVSGVLFEAERPDNEFGGPPDYGDDQLAELKKRFPPRKLDGLGPGLVWLPPKEHAEVMASICRNRPRKVS
jgi:hypothetical protein